MTGLFSVLTLGFLLGMRHATDADHMIAVTTLVVRDRSPGGAALIGAVWGLGHTLTILVVGGGIILLGWVIPVRVGLSLELSVGVMLIILGVVSLVGAYRRIRRARSAASRQGLHPALHPSLPEATSTGRLRRWVGDLRAYQLVRPLIVGVVHGLAGSAAVALMVLAAIEEPDWALFYLALFGAGTILGMMLISMAIALPLKYADRHLVHVSEGLRIASGAISVGFGLFLAYQIGVVRGLLTGAAG